MSLFQLKQNRTCATSPLIFLHVSGKTSSNVTRLLITNNRFPDMLEYIGNYYRHVVPFILIKIYLYYILCFTLNS